jgi:hypothetical protein
MRIKLKKVTVASLNASLVQTLVFLSFIPRSTTMQKQLHKIKTGICLHSVRTCTNVRLVAFAIVQLVAFAKGR